MSASRFFTSPRMTAASPPLLMYVVNTPYTTLSKLHAPAGPTRSHAQRVCWLRALCYALYALYELASQYTILGHAHGLRRCRLQ